MTCLVGWLVGWLVGFRKYQFLLSYFRSKLVFFFASSYIVLGNYL